MADFDVRLKSNGEYWQCWWLDGAGHRQTRSLGSKRKFSRRQAAAECRKIALDLALGRLSGASGRAPRLSEWLERYARLRTDLSLATRETNRYTGRYLTRFFENDPPIDAVTPAQAADWRTALANGELSLDNANHCDAPVDATVCRHVRGAKRMFAEAVDQELLIRNPFANLRGTPAEPIDEWPDVTAADMKLILDACPSAGWRSLFALCRWAGLRRGEALKLRWADVHWHSNAIVVNATARRVSTKHRLRRVPIESDLYSTGLTRLLIEARELSTGPLVCEGIDVLNVGHHAERIIDRAGVRYPKVFHTLRKCWECDLAALYPQHAVSRWAGHDITVSQRHYLRVSEAMWPKPPASSGEIQAQIVPNGAKTQ